MSIVRPPPTPACPACGKALQRIRRSAEDRQLHGGRSLHRFRCAGLDCGWNGLLPAVPLRWQAPAWMLRALWPVLLGVGALNIALFWWPQRPSTAQAILVGPHVVLPGTHLEGDRLPSAHALRERLPAAMLEDEPASFSQEPEARLRARRHCAWGLPGRDPYRGSVEQALQTAQLSPHVVKQIAYQFRTGKKTDRVEIRNDNIRAVGSGRLFDSRKVAMTYGMTLCVDTRVNFKPGHVERGDLYEAMDEDGRVYAVMVPDVCGNVSVLGQRSDLAFDPPGAGQRQNVAFDAPGAGPPPQIPGPPPTQIPRPPPTPIEEVLRLPPEWRPRELPAALLFSDPDEKRKSSSDRPNGALPLPGSLPLAGVGLAALLWLRRRR